MVVLHKILRDICLSDIETLNLFELRNVSILLLAQSYSSILLPAFISLLLYLYLLYLLV